MLISISEAKAKLNTLVSSDESSVITKNGTPKAAIIPYELYKNILRIQREIEDREAINKAEAYFSGKRQGVSQEELDQILDNT